MPNSDQILGCLYGGAIGDAMGFAYEGQTGPLTIDPNVEWRLSDDTQLTLATCEAIAATGIVAPDQIAARLADWYCERRLTGLGASTLKALSEVAAGGHWALVGRKGEMAAGNGAACRIAPLAFCLAADDYADRRTIREVCRITHHSDEAYLGALAVLTAVQWASDGRWQGGGELLNEIARTLPDCRVRDRLIEVDQRRLLSITDAAQQFGCTGYVVESVPLALHAATLLQAIGFEFTLESIVAAGGDCDTIASIAGQIMGAFCGLEGLPEHLVDRIPDASQLREIATRFLEVIRAREIK